MNSEGEGSSERSYRLEEIVTEKQIEIILEKVYGDAAAVQLVGGWARAAGPGLAGFLGDHVRAALLLRARAPARAPDHTLPLFVKRLPRDNPPKAEFIDANNYFRREKMVLDLLDEIGSRRRWGVSGWCVRALLATEALVVMRDLTPQGFAPRARLQAFDPAHALLAAASVARFHAAFADYETARALAARRPYDFYAEFGHLLTEPTFRDTPWLHAGAKLAAEFLGAFSARYGTLPRLRERLAALFVRACDSLRRADDSLNVVVHKDLWTNNILFRHEGGAPVAAVLIDYQCVRYAPPAFDLTSFLYLNTTRRFREEHETRVFHHYFEGFTAALGDATRTRLRALGYDESEFLRRCEASRLFAAFEALAIGPVVLMDARAAEREFADPATFLERTERDRSAPVLQYAAQHALYRDRILEVAEEFVERYVIPSP